MLDNKRENILSNTKKDSLISLRIIWCSKWEHHIKTSRRYIHLDEYLNQNQPYCNRMSSESKSTSYDMWLVTTKICQYLFLKNPYLEQ